MKDEFRASNLSNLCFDRSGITLLRFPIYALDPNTRYMVFWEGTMGIQKQRDSALDDLSRLGGGNNGRVRARDDVPSSFDGARNGENQDGLPISRLATTDSGQRIGRSDQIKKCPTYTTRAGLIRDCIAGISRTSRFVIDLRPACNYYAIPIFDENDFLLIHSPLKPPRRIYLYISIYIPRICIHSTR